MYERHWKPIEEPVSHFLFGARGTGKTLLLKKLYPESLDILYIDLLNNNTYQDYLNNKMLLEEIVVSKNYKWIIIDEIQRIPDLLNSVHRLIESNNLNFILTGSSARKLKRGQANLLAGRAFLNYLYPLTHLEMGSDFDLDAVLNLGSLPKITQLKSKAAKIGFLKTYVNTYLKEEIRDEQILRKLDPFYSFLKILATSNGEIINNSKLGRESGVSSKTVESYILILLDTLLGYLLPAYTSSVRQQTIQSSKFYFFDLGIKRALENKVEIPLEPSTYGYGFAFEHFFILECFRLNYYFNKNYSFSYIKTKAGLEIDLIIQRIDKKPLAIEIKSATSVDIVELRNKAVLSKELGCDCLYVASRESVSRKRDDIMVMPWQMLISKLFMDSDLV